MPFPLPTGHKFACIALTNAGIALGLTNSIDLGSNLIILFETPFSLNAAWREWLGTIQADRLAASTLVILAHRASANVGVIDTENQALTEQCLSMLYALFLADVFHYDSGLILSGSNDDGDVRVRQVSRLDTFILPNGVTRIRIDESMIRRASIIAEGIRDIHTSGSHHVRLRQGFHACREGLTEFYGAERLHQFVRAVEGVVKPKIGVTKKQFIDRGQVFAGNSAAAISVLRQLYELRSLAEHLHPFGNALASYPPDQHERIALRRAYQAQLLASNVYERILSSGTLRALFSADDDIDAFWAQTRPQQILAWGKPIDLELKATARLLL
jgi:hypothetical protein